MPKRAYINSGVTEGKNWKHIGPTATDDDTGLYTIATSPLFVTSIIVSDRTEHIGITPEGSASGYLIAEFPAPATNTLDVEQLNFDPPLRVDELYCVASTATLSGNVTVVYE